MKLDSKVAILFVLVLASSLFYFLGGPKKSARSEDYELEQPVQNYEVLQKNKAILQTAASVKTNQTAPKTQAAEKEKTDQEYLDEQYVQLGYGVDAENPGYLFKWHTKKNGEKVKLYAPKGRGSIDPKQTTVRDALQTLASKKDLNPDEEISSLRRLDEKIQDNLMLFGTFRDEQNDLEIYLSTLTDEVGNSLNKDLTCFYWPKLQIAFKKKLDNGLEVRADETGYGILKLASTRFARVMWSYEKGRILHGEIWELLNGAYVKTNIFVANEIRPLDGDQVKYCE